LVDEWAAAIGLRRTIWNALAATDHGVNLCKATRDLRAVQILLGHTKIENTFRYLGVNIEDALTLAEGAEI
jgi:site-specific recombinase XerC